MNVLVTGARGTIGRKLSAALEGDYELRLLSRREMGGEAWRRVDVTEIAQVKEAMEGMDAVIHLAIATGQEGDYEGDAFNAQRLDINVKGTYNVFEAARECGVKHVIYTSSLTVVWGYTAPEWVTGDAPAKPVGTYALTKHLGEEIARTYATGHDLSVLCLRIPKPIDIDDPTSRDTSVLPQWMAFPDLLQAYRLGLNKADLGFEIVTVVGESSKRRWDLARAESILGYRGQYRLEDMGYELRVEPTAYDREGVVRGEG